MSCSDNQSAYSVFSSDYEHFKAEREKTGMPVRKFSSEAGISVSSLFYYENGTYSLLNLNVNKAIAIFSYFDISIDDFCRKWYPDLYSEVFKTYEMWKMDNRELSYIKLHNRYKARFAKYHSRKKFDQNTYEFLYNRYVSLFKVLKDKTDDSGFISQDMYEDCIVPFSYELSKALEKSVPSSDSAINPVSAHIHDLLLRSDLLYKDLAAIIGVSPWLFKNYHNSEDGYSNIKLESAIKISSVFNTTVYDLFC